MFSVVGSKKHISELSYFEAKMSVIWCDFTQGRCFILIFPQTFSCPCGLGIMLHVLFSLLGVSRGVKTVLAFLQILGLILVAL